MKKSSAAIVIGAVRVNEHNALNYAGTGANWLQYNNVIKSVNNHKKLNDRVITMIFFQRQSKYQ